MNIFSCFKLGTTTDKTTEYSDYNIYLVNYSSSNSLMRTEVPNKIELVGVNFLMGDLILLRGDTSSS